MDWGHSKLAIGLEYSKHLHEVRDGEPAAETAIYQEVISVRLWLRISSLTQMGYRIPGSSL